MGHRKMKKTVLALAILASFLAGSAQVWLIAPPGMPDHSQSTGKALIGGPFTLVNHKGQTVTDRDFRGKYMLIFFGYTFCPDVCPADLAIISQALDALGPAARKITPVFITIDPQRDTVAQMAEYVANFHKSFVGLTGTPEQIKAAAKAYRVYYARPDISKNKNGKKDSADYVMDHSAITFLMGPDGNYISHFPHGTRPDAMAAKLRTLVK